MECTDTPLLAESNKEQIELKETNPLIEDNQIVNEKNEQEISENILDQQKVEEKSKENLNHINIGISDQDFNRYLKKIKREYPGLFNERIDTKIYRQDLKLSDNNKNLKENILFFENKIESMPDGDYLENIHENWWGEYDLLEQHHAYIQWLFPIREQGVNYHAHPLQLHELQYLSKSEEAIKNLLKSFEMMLDFYGMVLNKETGSVSRAENYRERYKNLKRKSHNYLRITRILKCLGDFGLEKFQLGLLEFLMEEIFISQKLTNLDHSFTGFFIYTIKDDTNRNKLIDKVISALVNQLAKDE